MKTQVLVVIILSFFVAILVIVFKIVPSQRTSFSRYFLIDKYPQQAGIISTLEGLLFPDRGKEVKEERKHDGWSAYHSFWTNRHVQPSNTHALLTSPVHLSSTDRFLHDLFTSYHTLSSLRVGNVKHGEDTQRTAEMSKGGVKREFKHDYDTNTSSHNLDTWSFVHYLYDSSGHFHREDTELFEIEPPLVTHRKETNIHFFESFTHHILTTKVSYPYKHKIGSELVLPPFELPEFPTSIIPPADE